MSRTPAALAAVFALGVALPGAAQVPATAAPAPAPAYVARSTDETALLAADARQRIAVRDGDLQAVRQGAHPNFRVNAPNNRILTREDLIGMLASGAIRNEVYDRTVEGVTITGDVGVVMGREQVYPGAASGQARLYGQRTLNRRFTNIYLREGGVWLQLARHANVVSPP